LGTELVVPIVNLKEGSPETLWVKIPGTPNAEVNVTMQWSKIKQTEVPEILKTHTGGSTKAFHNSITRSQLKKRIREGDRGMDKEVHFLTVKVHEAKDLTSSVRDGTALDPYFSIYLHSSQQIVYKILILYFF